MAEAAVKKSTGLLSKSSAPATRSKAAKSGKRGQLVILLLLLVCFVASLYFFKQTMDAVASSSNIPEQGSSAPSQEVVNESAEVEKLGNDLSGMTQSTNLAMQTASMAEQIARLPIASSSTLSPPPPPPDPNPDPIFEPDPPVMLVKAVMITEGDSVAIVDIVGEDSGLLVRRGSKFSDGTARVTKIDSKGVTFTWMKKSYAVAVER
jgi:hypothetical protein